MAVVTLYDVYKLIVERMLFKDIDKNTRFRRHVVSIRRSLFEEELSFLRNVRLSSDLNCVIRFLKDTKDQAKSIQWPIFKGYFNKVLDEIIKHKTIKEDTCYYPKLIAISYECYNEKVNAIRNNLNIERIEPRDTFWLMTLCFIFNLVKIYNEKTVEKPSTHSIGKMDTMFLSEMLDNYFMDFIFPYTYIRRKPHVIRRGSDTRIVKVFSQWFTEEKRWEIYRKHIAFRDKLRSEHFPFDISKPILREGYRKILGKTWDSLILVIYPESTSKSQSYLDPYEGRKLEKLRLHTVVYTELLTDAERTEYILICNKNLKDLRSGEEKAVKRVLKEIVGLSERDLDIIFNRSDTCAVNTEVLVNELQKAILQGFDATEKVMEEMKQKIHDIALDKQLTRKNEILSFINSLKIVGITLRARRKKKILAEFKATILYTSFLGEEMSEKEVVGKAEDIFATFRKFKNYYEPHGNEIELILELEGEINGRTACIQVSNKNIVYNKMSRDIASELTYILSEAFK